MIEKLFTPAMVGYVLTIAAVNVGFAYIPLFHTPIGTFAPMALLVGAVFVIRDYAQRGSGHYVLFAMAAGLILSYYMANPYVAMASAAAFAISEIFDWLVYTFSKMSFSKRVLFSSVMATPVDSLVFLYGINQLTIGTFVLMTLSKLFAALVIYLWRNYPE